MTDQQQRAERTEEIRRKLEDPKVPLEAIFPQRLWTPPSVDPQVDGVAEFRARDLPTPHRGSTLRFYVLWCNHGSTTVTLVAHGGRHQDEQDGEVLRNMLGTLRTNAAKVGVTCQCWPKGWMAA